MEFSFRFSSSSSDAAAQSNFEMRTRFTVRRMLDEEGDDDAFDCEMLERECLPLSLSSSSDSSDQLRRLISHRLSEYSMPADQIQALLRESFRRVASADDVIVDVSVCTVQKDGETMDEVMDRSVRPECLVPLDLLLGESPLRDFLLYGLPRIRAGDENPMDACPICMGGPTSGPPVSRLPCCGQAFHTHCVVRWLLQGGGQPSCPLCRHNPTNWAAIRFESPAPLGPVDLPAQRKRKRPTEDMPAQPPAKRNRQPSSWLRDYYVT